MHNCNLSWIRTPPVQLNPRPTIYVPDTPVEEVFGGNTFVFGPAGVRGRGNVFLCTTPKKLIEQRQYLNPTAAANLQFVVYEGATFAGVYNLIAYNDLTGQGPGEGWYSSGPMDVDFQAGMYYLIYAQWDVNANYYNNQSITPYPIDCSFGQLVGGVGWDWAPTYAVPPSPTQTSTGLEGTGVAYYQTIVTDDIGGGGAGYFTDFESFVSGGQVACQDTNWTTWNMTPCDPTTDAYISSNYAFSGVNSAVVVQNNDLVKPLGDQTSGKWYIGLMVYIPSGKSGYFNTMNDFYGATQVWGHDCYFDVGGTGRVDTTGGGGATFNVAFNWTQDAWNQIIVIVDLDAPGTPAEFWIGTSPANFTQVATWDWTQAGTKPAMLSVNDFYGAAATDEMYFDDYYFGDSMPPIVPVELTSFTANAINGFVELNWSTATEINNQGFEIERRTESSEFRTIAFVEGNGTTTEQNSYSFVDRTAEQGVNFYRLKQLDFDGTYAYSDVVEVNATGPLSFELAQNYPNPFNPTTNIKFSVPESGNVKLSVYNLVGEEVAVLVNGFSQAGTFEVTFDASNLSTGVYLYKLQSANSVQTKKMMLLK